MMKRYVIVLAALAVAFSACSQNSEIGSEGDAAATLPASETTPSSPVGDTESMRVLARGTYGPAASATSTASAPSIHVARNESTYRALWSSNVTGVEAPPIDFGRETVVFLLQGVQPTGGYGVDPLQAETGDGKLTVRARLIRPGEGDMVTQAFTAPYAVIVVRGTGFGLVEWVAPDGRLIATETAAVERGAETR